MKGSAARIIAPAKQAAHQAALGSQVVLDLYDCQTTLLDDMPWVETTLKNAARVAGATIVRTVFHKFAPWGISGVVVISESHLAVHIWPENRYAAIDIFTCGESVRLEVACDFLKRAFCAGRSVQRSFARGDQAHGAREGEATHRRERPALAAAPFRS